MKTCISEVSVQFSLSAASRMTEKKTTKIKVKSKLIGYSLIFMTRISVIFFLS